MPVPRPVLIALALAPIFAIATASAIMCDAVTTVVDGELRATDGALGEWVMSAPTCHSGEPLGFYGVELRDAKVGWSLRLVHPPGKDPLISAEALDKGGRSTVLTAAKCETLEVEIRRTDKRLGRVSLVDGRATIDCPGLQGELDFVSCR